MTEENVTKYRCDRCGTTEEIVLSEVFLGRLKKAEQPASWGKDKDKKDLLCAKCYKEYQDGYISWYAKFMSHSKEV